MDYLIPVIIISIILSLCMIITSIVILRNIKKAKHSPADIIKPIVDQLAAIHKDLDTIRRNSVNAERNIATIKNSINTINASQVTDYYLSQILSLKKVLGQSLHIHRSHIKSPSPQYYRLWWHTIQTHILSGTRYWNDRLSDKSNVWHISSTKTENAGLAQDNVSRYHLTDYRRSHTNHRYRAPEHIE